MKEQLDVYLCNQPVGTLTRSDTGALSFQYLPEYLKSNAIPLSSTLPLDATPFKERDIAAFFSNLLPDESVRQKIAHILHLTPEDTFGLLRLIGGDCAGAVAFHEPGKSPATVAQPTYRELSSSEAAALLSDLSNRPLGIGDDFRGISGAGAQDKLIACLRDGKILLPLNGTPSTHIIKPGIDRFPESVFNEWFCMRLSKACGFDTADCDILEVDGTPYYVTTRYDRETQDGITKRLHQEDFCQLLKCRPEIKYQDQGGPSIVDCTRALQDLRLPASDIMSFIDPVKTMIDNGRYAFASLDTLENWNTVLGLQFENLIVNNYTELIPHLHLGSVLLTSAAPYRKSPVPSRKQKGYQIDLLIQSRRTTYIVEIKRKNEIDRSIITEVDEKTKRLKRNKDISIKTALVYSGSLAPIVEADGYFDAIVPVETLLGLPNK